MDFKTIIPIVLVAILTVVGNILFFKYQFNRQNKYSILHKQLTELLLPLFYVFHEYAIESREWRQNDDYNYVEDVISTPKVFLKKIVPIIKNNLYLADDELHVSCIEFLDWASKFDENEAYNKSHKELPDLEKFDEFHRIVEKKYENTKKRYLKY